MSFHQDEFHQTGYQLYEHDKMVKLLSEILENEERDRNPDYIRKHPMKWEIQLKESIQNAVNEAWLIYMDKTFDRRNKP